VSEPPAGSLLVAVLRYNALRLGLVVGFLAIGYLVGLAGIVLIVVALIASSVVSYFLLTGARQQMFEAVQAHAEARRVRAAARAAREDDYDEQQRRDQPES